MNRALREFRIRGVATNLTFLENDHQSPVLEDKPTHAFIDTTPELFAQVKRRRTVRRSC
jgi:pyruvate carboxylase